MDCCQVGGLAANCYPFLVQLVTDPQRMRCVAHGTWLSEILRQLPKFNRQPRTLSSRQPTFPHSGRPIISQPTHYPPPGYMPATRFSPARFPHTHGETPTHFALSIAQGCRRRTRPKNRINGGQTPPQRERLPSDCFRTHTKKY